MTDYWQCLKCKTTKEISIKTTLQEFEQTDGASISRTVIDKDDIPLIVHCCHVMRNLTLAQYENENSLNDNVRGK